jgi:hypothetical protein
LSYERSFTKCACIFPFTFSKPHAIKNPHLRAKITDALEALLPVKKREELSVSQNFVATVNYICLCFYVQLRRPLYTINISVITVGILQG